MTAKPNLKNRKSTKAISRTARRMVLLGSTGSIGMNALNVARQMGEQCKIVGLSAYGNIDRLEQQIAEFQPEVVAVWEEKDAVALRQKGLRSRGKALEVLSGLKGLVTLAAWEHADFLLSSVVGAVGLEPLLAGIRSGKTIALANKEALVMAGELVMSEVKRWNATLLPVDSEHSAIFQCLQGQSRSGIKRLILTASGGPFYRYEKSLDDVTVEQALAHPTWKMGKKITIDSATLMNKGLETIEAAILFGLPIDQVDIVIHPQSIVHSLVEFQDAAMLAQLSTPDMCLPIQYAITFPDRYVGPLEPLNLAKMRTLEFLEPDFRKFPCLGISREAARRGGTFPAVMNAADEIAVYSFLQGKVKFTEIPVIVEKTLSKYSGSSRVTLSNVLAADQWGRNTAKEMVNP